MGFCVSVCVCVCVCVRVCGFGMEGSSCLDARPSLALLSYIIHVYTLLASFFLPFHLSLNMYKFITNGTSCTYMYMYRYFTFDSSDVLKSMSQDNLMKQQGPTFSEVAVTRRRHHDLDHR